jgi:hypothetical protein
MMRSTSALAWAILLATAAPSYTAAAGTVHLSPVQASVVAGKIAKLKYPQERSLASHWSDAKKVAEFICRPLATAVLKREHGADRIFLGTDDPRSLRLLDDRELQGSGQYRSGKDWHTFTFSCALDPRNGAAASFKTSARSGQ